MVPHASCCYYYQSWQRNAVFVQACIVNKHALTQLYIVNTQKLHIYRSDDIQNIYIYIMLHTLYVILRWMFKQPLQKLNTIWPVSRSHFLLIEKDSYCEDHRLSRSNLFHWNVPEWPVIKSIDRARRWILTWDAVPLICD